MIRDNQMTGKSSYIRIPYESGKTDLKDVLEILTNRYSDKFEFVDTRTDFYAYVSKISGSCLYNECLYNEKVIFQNAYIIKDKISSRYIYFIVHGSDILITTSDKYDSSENICWQENIPKGYVSATTDGAYPTVVELAPIEFNHRDIFPCGRLDKDTTGLMILSDDGNFAHDILSPKKHVSKEYYVEIDKDLTEEMVIAFRDGVLLKDGECKSSELKIIDKRSCYVTLTEGRYHQIKRMFGCFGAEVLELKRIRMGNFKLPEDLAEGECRELTENELNSIKE